MTLTVGDGPSVQKDTAVTQFTARTASDLISTWNSLKRSDRLYAVLTRTTNGLVIGSSEMPNLPPSVLATLNNDRTAGGFKSSAQTVIAEQEISPAAFIISGQQSITIQVVN